MVRHLVIERHGDDLDCPGYYTSGAGLMSTVSSKRRRASLYRRDVRQSTLVLYVVVNKL